VGSGQAQVNYGAEATVATPTLVEVQPGVQVVADYDQPVFYNEGVYWRFEGGVWYRSPYHDRAWIRVEAPPVAVRRIQRPEMYVHYHATGNARAEERHEENQERHEENRERHEENRERHEENQERKDDRQVAHDRAEVKDENREIARDKAEERHDEKERAKDEKALKKDEKKREKDRR
jgi:hypothetical protein